MVCYPVLRTDLTNCLTNSQECSAMASALLTTRKMLDKLPRPKTGQSLYWDTDLHG